MVKLRNFVMGAAIAVLPMIATADTIRADEAGAFGAENLMRTIKVGGDNFETEVFYAGAMSLVTGVDSGFTGWSTQLPSTRRFPADYQRTETAFSADVADSVSRLFTGFGSAISTADQAAAFQVALWEILSDDGEFNLMAGGFQMLNTGKTHIRGMANDFLSGLSNVDATTEVTFVTSGSSVDLALTDMSIFAAQSTTPPNDAQVRIVAAAVPLPSSALLLLAGLGALGMRRRKRG